MQKNSVIGIGLLVAAVAVLLIGARSLSEPKENMARVWGGTDVACLPFGHQNLAQHIHPHLTITVDGENEAVPANVGLNETCMSELHTHDATGQIHIETVAAGKTFTLLDYFRVLGESIDREGYTYQVFVDGQPIDVTNYILEDLDRIELQYASG